MFKNIQHLKICPTWVADLATAETALNLARFQECELSQERSVGWTEPRGEENGLLIEAIGGHWIAKLMFESKMLPASVVKEEVEKRVVQIETATGNKPGKKEKKEITEDVRNALLSKAFTKKSAAFVWIDPTARRLVIEASTKKRSDEVVTELVKLLEGFGVKEIETQQSPANSMSQWLDTQEPPAGFTADRECTLKSCDESKATVSYKKHSLEIDEIRAHITGGKIPTMLAMTWDSRVSFVLTDAGTIKKIEILDVVTSDKTESDFDANVAIATGELSKMIPAIIECLGGEIQTEEK